MKPSKKRYQKALNLYEQSIADVEKKENGIFYTDLILANKMIRGLRLPKDAFLMDPCCGTGVFLFAAKQCGFSHLCGMDSDEKAISFCKTYFPNLPFFSGDTIGKPKEDVFSSIGITEQPDAVVGNPPYVPFNGNVEKDWDPSFRDRVSKMGGNLFIAALIRAFELVKEGGVVSYILPKNFLHVSGYRTLRQALLSEKTILSLMDIGAYFKSVRGEQIVLTAKNCPPEKNHRILIKRLEGRRVFRLTKIPQDFYADEILLFNSFQDYTIYKKMKTYPTIADLNSEIRRGKSTSPNAVTGKEIQKFGYKNRVLPSLGNQIFLQNIYSAESGIIAAFGGDLPASQTVTILRCEEETDCRYLLGILHSRLCNLFLYKYCYNSSKLTMHTDAKYLQKIPLPTKEGQSRSFEKIAALSNRLETLPYRSAPWFEAMEALNRTVYDAYDLTPGEAAYVDGEMKQIQSKRWNADGQLETL